MSDLRDDVARVLGAYPTPGMWSDKMTKRIRQQAFGEADAILAIPAIASALAGRDAVIEQCVEAVRSRFVYEDEGGGWRRQTSLEEVTGALRALKAAIARMEAHSKPGVDRSPSPDGTLVD